MLQKDGKCVLCLLITSAPGWVPLLPQAQAPAMISWACARAGSGVAMPLAVISHKYT